MAWVTEHLIELLLITGLALMALEILVLGFATFVLLFVGIAAVATAGLIYIDVIAYSVLNAVMSVAVLTGISAAILWRPLKNMQQEVDPTRESNDLIGMQFVLDQDVSPGSNATYRYSGIEWQLRVDGPVSSGTTVEVTKTDVGVFHIRPVGA